METLEDEIIKRYNTLTLQSTYDNINSSSDEEKRDFFGIGKMDPQMGFAKDSFFLFYRVIESLFVGDV